MGEFEKKEKKVQNTRQMNTITSHRRTLEDRLIMSEDVIFSTYKGTTVASSKQMAG